MVDINLLPWRAKLYEKKYRRRKFFGMLSVVCIGVIFLLLHLFLQMNIHLREQKITELTAKRNHALAVAAQPEQAILAMFMPLQREQQRLLKLLQILNDASRYHLQFSALSYQPLQTIRLTGRGASWPDISNWLHQINQQTYFSARLLDWKRLPEENHVQFTLLI